MVLDFGGDDITSFMHVLLERTGFPYKEADLSKWYDWIVLEDLKERSVVLSEVSRFVMIPQTSRLSLSSYHPSFCTRRH